MLRGRRRRGRDRAARDQLALEQVRRPGDRRRGAAGPAPERLQDREPDRPRTHPRARPRRAAGRLRPPSDPRHRWLRRRGSAGRARALRGRPRRGARRDRGGEGRLWRQVADDRPPHAEGLDWPDGGRRPAGREQLALAPGPDRRPAREPRAPEAAGGVAALVPTGGALHGGRRAAARAARAPAERRQAHER